MKIVAIVQARMRSTRLPDKVLLKIVGKPMLWHVVDRLKRSQFIDEIVIATSSNKSNKAIVDFAVNNNIKYFRGSEDDVLDRFYQAARQSHADIIIRITADCPLMDPHIVDRAVKQLIDNKLDYVNILKTLPGGKRKTMFPDGLDVEVFLFSALKLAWKRSNQPTDKEHVTSYIWNRPEEFKLGYIENERDLSEMRWTVDYKADLRFVREVYKSLYKEGDIFYMEDVLKILEKSPQLLNINKNVVKQRDEEYFQMREQGHFR